MYNVAVFYLDWNRFSSAAHRAELLQTCFRDLSVDSRTCLLEMLSGKMPKRKFTVNQLRDYFIAQSELPDWLIAASHQDLGDWIAAISLLYPISSSFSEHTVEYWLNKIDDIESIEEVKFLWSQQSQAERVFFNRLLTGKASFAEDHLAMSMAVAEWFKIDIPSASKWISDSDFKSMPEQLDRSVLPNVRIVLDSVNPYKYLEKDEFVGLELVEADGKRYAWDTAGCFSAEYLELFEDLKFYGRLYLELFPKNPATLRFSFEKMLKRKKLDFEWIGVRLMDDSRAEITSLPEFVELPNFTTEPSSDRFRVFDASWQEGSAVVESTELTLRLMYLDASQGWSRSPLMTFGLQEGAVWIPYAKVIGDFSKSECLALRDFAKTVLIEKRGPVWVLHPEREAVISYQHKVVNKRKKAGFDLEGAAFVRWI